MDAREHTSTQTLQQQFDESPTRLYLLRHGELVTSKKWIYVGHMDVELNEAGAAQVGRAAARFEHIKVDGLYSSDLIRTKESAAIIGGVIKRSVTASPELREINLGRWEGLTLSEIRDRFEHEFSMRSMDLAEYRIEGGESFRDVYERVMPFLSKCLSLHKGGTVLMVAHGGVNRVIICDALGLPLDNCVRIDQNYACINIIDYYSATPVVRLLNSTEHLAVPAYDCDD